MKSKKTIILFDIDYTLFDTKHFKESGLVNHKIYDEVVDVLGNLKNIGEFGIFSKGDDLFQKEKLEKTGISKYFNKKYIHVFKDKDIKLMEVIDLYKDYRIFLVDDKLDILYYAQKHRKDVVTIWVKRGPFAEKQKPISGFKPNLEVKDLLEIVKYISEKSF
jgi:FMN phosphatase YigB (HAD superfamily)